jgi:two-component system, cell cycle sensor histidine kinase and response regulator CckA
MMPNYELLFQSLPDPTWVYDLSTLRFLAVNQAAVAAYGYSTEEFLSMSIADIRPNEDVERLIMNVAQVTDGCDHAGVWRHKRKDGSLIDVQITSQVMEFDGRPAEVVVAKNVSGKAYRDERLQVALQGAKLSVWEYNIGDESLSWDPVFSGSYGIDRAIFPQNVQEFLQLVDEEYRQSLSDAFYKCVEEGEEYKFEYRIKFPGRDPQWRFAFGKRLLDPVGTPIKVIGIGIDITERKLLERELARKREFESIGHLATGIANDFNNVLTIINNYAFLLTEQTTPEFVTENAKEILSATSRASQLIQNLLQFSRNRHLPARPVDLNSVVRTASELSKIALPASVQFVANLDPCDPIVLAEQGQIEQIVTNLCFNAREAIAHSGTITISTSHETDKLGMLWATIVVSDTGSGIAENLQGRIFEPFFTTKRVRKGSGLGLTIVEGIATQMGATVSFHSIADQGSTFTVRIPAVTLRNPLATD